MEVHYHNNFLKLFLNTDDVKVQVVDLTGRVVYKNDSPSNNIDLSFLSKGIYIYRIELSHTILSDKIVVH